MYCFPLSRGTASHEAFQALERVRGRIETEALEHHANQPAHSPRPFDTARCATISRCRSTVPGVWSLPAANLISCVGVASRQKRKLPCVCSSILIAYLPLTVFCTRRRLVYRTPTIRRSRISARPCRPHLRPFPSRQKRQPRTKIRRYNQRAKTAQNASPLARF